MWRQTAFPRNEDLIQSLSDDDIEDELGYDNDCTEKLSSLYSNGKKTSSSFTDYHQTEVHKSGENSKVSNEPIQSPLKEECPSDPSDDSISNEDNIAATESSLGYQSVTSKFGERIRSSNKFDGSELSEWIQILEESSGLDCQSKKPVSIRDEEQEKPRSIHSISNQEQPIQELPIKENSCLGDTSLHHNFDILEDINEEDDIVPYNMICYEQKECRPPSMAELLEGLQAKNCAPSVLNPNVKTSDREEKKRILPNLGKRMFENEDDPPECIADHTSSDEEEINQNKLSLLPQQIEGQKQTMADLFQEAFNASNDMWPALSSTNPSGTSFHGRLLQVMQLDKERHAEFSRFFDALHLSSNKIDKSSAITVQIISRSLEGRLIVCRCLFQLTLQGKKLERFVGGDAKKEGTVIFNPKICENVDLVVGNLICIYPPWKEVLVKEENIILCNYYSSDVV